METFVVIGGVAGGATAAARLRRLSEHAKIILFERGEYISFANCGLPYHIGGVITERNNLLVTTSEYVTHTFNIEVRTKSEVCRIIPDKNTVEVKNLDSGETYTESYSKLLLSPGATPLTPSVEGSDLEGVFILRNMGDMDKIVNFIGERKPKTAVVAGGGFIGLEMVENFANLGLKVKLVQRGAQTMKHLDFEMAAIIHDHLSKKGIGLYLGDALVSIKNQGSDLEVKLNSGTSIPCDIVVSGLGVRPEVWLAAEAGLEIGPNGGITVDDNLRTSDPNIYAVGDAIQVKHKITGQTTLLPLAGPANKQGRMAADNMCGANKTFKGVLGTEILHAFDLTIARTGLSEKNLDQNDIPFETVSTHPFSHAGYYPGSEQMAMKMVFSKDDGRVLGAQIIGGKGVDKRIDVLATAIHARMTVGDLAELELAYAPQYSSAKDPVNMLGFVGENILSGKLQTISFNKVDELGSDYLIIDVRTRGEFAKGAIENAQNIPVAELRENLERLPKNKPLLVYCFVGIRGYLACRILLQNGFGQVFNLNGGYRTYCLATRNC